MTSVETAAVKCQVTQTNERDVVAAELRQRASEFVKTDIILDGVHDMEYDFLNFLMCDATGAPGDCGIPQDSKPGWYDPELLREGQQCALRHLVGICESQLLSLFLVFIVPHGPDPLIATGKSDTPFAAFQRYLSTALRVLSWYEGDPFDPKSRAWKNLVAVRSMHRAVRNMCHTTSKEELEVKFSVGKCPGAEQLWCPMTPVLTELFKEAQFTEAKIVVDADRWNRPFLSQGEMAYTQFSFFGLFALFPELFGAPFVSRRELEGLVHLWAVVAHCLGVEDRFNWCLGGLDATINRSKAVLDHWNKPLFKSPSPIWEHMSRCAFEGIKMYAPGLGHIEAHFAYLFEDVLRIHSALPKKLTWLQWFQLQEMRFFFQVLPRWFPSVLTWFSHRLRELILLASKFSEEKLRRLQERKYSFASSPSLTLTAR